MTASSSELPVLAFTLGDVAGIGPEVVVQSCADARLAQWCRPLVVGHPEVVRRAADVLGIPVQIARVDRPEAAMLSSNVLTCWDPGPASAADVPPGRVDARSGQAAFDYLCAATRAALRGAVDGITTAPLSKAALHAAGHDYPGHTEILAELCGVAEFGMMLYLPSGPSVRGECGLGVVHTTLHTSIASVPGLLSTTAVLEKIRLVDGFMRNVGCKQPRVCVCALNPHAGEDGLFGDEESRVIAPAVAEAGKAGLDVSGPLPADTLLKRAVDGEFDAVVAMYHDQGHIALKLIAFNMAVNVTLGLPIVRTSPSHGTAFDIAGTGRADAAGFVEAVRVASLLAQNRGHGKFSA